MDRQKALSLIKKYLSNENLIKHCLACEAAMIKLAEKLNEDRQIWGLAGLLHDLDYEITKNEPQKHTLVTAEILKANGVSEEVIEIIKGHNADNLGIEIKKRGQRALYVVDPTTGFIVAATLMHPTKKIKNLDLQFLMNRFKEKSFARGANREQIKKCEELGLTLEEFLLLVLEAMQGIAGEIGLD